ncbi:hypothetical protein P692DRAFT_20525989 [Suillus brevipes Sb2]|nr:hypothetical protein P692DRAFT_20525989 [Suillus brevipes Sb2]
MLSIALLGLSQPWRANTLNWLLDRPPKILILAAHHVRRHRSFPLGIQSSDRAAQLCTISRSRHGFSSIQVIPDLNLTSSLYPVFSLTGDDLRFSISADLGFIVQAASATIQRVHLLTELCFKGN